MLLRNVGQIFTSRYGVASQKTSMVMGTAVRTSNQANNFKLHYGISQNLLINSELLISKRASTNMDI